MRKQRRLKPVEYAESPPAGVRFTPVPFVLIPVVVSCGGEHVPDIFPTWLAGQKFDAWKRGDFYVYRRDAAEWRIAKRWSEPSAARQMVALTPDDPPWRVAHSWYDGDNYRIALPFLAAAAKLFGRVFQSKEALEDALRNEARKRRSGDA